MNKAHPTQAQRQSYFSLPTEPLKIAFPAGIGLFAIGVLPAHPLLALGLIASAACLQEEFRRASGAALGVLGALGLLSFATPIPFDLPPLAAVMFLLLGAALIGFQWSKKEPPFANLAWIAAGLGTVWHSSEYLMSGLVSSYAASYAAEGPTLVVLLALLLILFATHTVFVQERNGESSSTPYWMVPPRGWLVALPLATTAAGGWMIEQGNGISQVPSWTVLALIAAQWAGFVEQARYLFEHRSEPSPHPVIEEWWLESLPDGALVSDASGQVLHNNGVAEHMLGARAGGLRGASLFQLLPNMPKNCSAVLTGNPVCHCPSNRPCSGCVITVPRESVAPVSIEIKFARLALASDVEHSLVLLRDVTEARNAEQALGRSERLLRCILEALPVGVWVTDVADTILFDNPAGRAIWDGSIPFSADATTTWWPTARETGTAPLSRKPCPPGTTVGTYEIRQRGGEVKTVACLRSPLWNGEQNEGTLIVQQDLSEFYRVEKDLRLADAMLERLLNSLAIGVVVTDLTRKLVMANETLCKLLGYGKMDLGHMVLEELLHPADALACHDAWDAVVTGRTPWLQREVRCMARNGSTRWVLIHASVVREPDGQPLYLVSQVVDIDARKQAEKSLTMREHLFTMAQRIARLGSWEWQPLEGNFSCSPEAALILGVSGQGPAHLKTLLTAIHPEDRAGLKTCLQQLEQEGRDFDLDCRLMAMADKGQHRIVKLRGTQLAPEVAAAHYVGTVIDVTEYREMVRELWASRDSLRLLSARQEKLLEDERKRIAMELHDELGQLLTGIKMNNSAIQMRKADEPAVIKQTRRIEELAEKAIGVVRQVATSLRPLVLDMGLEAALSWQARNFQRMFGTPCELTICCKDLPRNENIEVTIFRAVQEALTNVSRHAAASKVWIEMDIEDDQLAVRIKDNGNGFDASTLIPGKTLGLLGQKERMHGLGGCVAIESLPGTGTTVVLTIPITPQSTHDHSASYH